MTPAELRQVADKLNELADMIEQSGAAQQLMDDARDSAISARDKLRESIEAAERG